MARCGGPAGGGQIAAIALVLLAGSCRDDADRVSGTPYVCECELTADFEGAERVVAVCALTTGQAMRAAFECVESTEDVSVQFCDCDEDTQVFCEFGVCSPV